MTTTAPLRDDTRPRTLLGLPRTVFPVAVFATFDIFAFYGTQTILVYYVYFSVVEGGLELPVSVALALVSAYSGAVFLMTVFAGWLADRVLGSGRTLRWGAVLAIAGYATLAIVPGTTGLTLGLIAIALGTSALWVSEGTVVGGTLDGFPAKRDAGFTLYYLGSALGGFLGILATGFLQSGVGFRIGFGASALALLIGLLVYLPSRRATEATAPGVTGGQRVRGWRLYLPIALVVAGIAAVTAAIAGGYNPALLVAVIALVLVVVYFSRMLASPAVEAEEKKGVIRYLPFFLATLVFCGLYQQLYTTVAVHSESQTDRFIFGIELPPSTVLAIAPLCTILVAPILAVLWGKLGERQPALSLKFAAAFLLCGFGMLALSLSAGSPGLTPLIILVFIVFTFGASDMVLSPAGISLATAVAPKPFKTQMLSMHYLGVAVGTAAAGVASEYFLPGENEQVFFLACALLAFAVTIGMVIARFAFGRRLIAGA